MSYSRLLQEDNFDTEKMVEAVSDILLFMYYSCTPCIYVCEARHLQPV